MNRALRVSSESGLVSVLDIPPLRKRDSKPGYVRIILEGILKKNHFLVEYRVVLDDTGRFVQRVFRIVPDYYRLGCPKWNVVSYYASPALCEALDFRLEALSLSESLLCDRQDVKKALNDVFKIKTNIFGWCLDQIEAAQRIIASDEPSGCVSFDFHLL